MERVLARVALVVLLCDLAVVGVRTAGSETRVRDVPGPPGRTEVVLPEGQSVVRGMATTIAVDAESVPVLPLPFTIEGARATVRGAVVGGERSTVVWNGGRPFALDGGGAGLEASPAHVELLTDAVVVALDGTPRPLLAGTYRTPAPVAVGTGGLATPRDGAAFTADAQTTVEAAGRIRTDRRVLHLAGPGRLSATGTFTVRTRDGERSVTTVVFGPGPFELSATPVVGGWAVTATLQGALDTTSSGAAASPHG